MKKNPRKRRQYRFTKKIKGSESRPRLVVFRSNKHIYTQIVNDETQRVIAGLSSLSKPFKEKKVSSSTQAGAKEVGKLLAAKAIELGIKNVCFDKGGYKYHGKIKAIAEGAREGGLIF